MKKLVYYALVFTALFLIGLILHKYDVNQFYVLLIGFMLAPVFDVFGSTFMLEEKKKK